MSSWYRVRPIDGQWPGTKTPAAERRSKWTFRAKWSDTINRLEYELAFLDASQVVIQIDVPERDIRLDGMLRATAHPSTPGVIVSFESKFGPLSYPCDSCEKWQHNVRSIALALESLRSVNRYGVAGRAEQYRGWTKLAAPGSLQTFNSIGEAKRFIDELLDHPNWNDPKAVIRKAKRAAHPDAGGTPRQFKLVVEAERLILSS